MSDSDKVLIFQIGSLGDTVISMPCYREIARRHPGAKRYLLTNFPIGSKMVPAEALLTPCGLIDEAVEYPMPLRGAKNIAALYRRLRALKIDVLYYLMPEKRFSNLLRHYAFFRACGIGKVYGVPWSRDLRFSRQLLPGRLWETEGSRLLRTLNPQRPVSPPHPSDRGLDLTDAEYERVDRVLSQVGSLARFIAFSVGGKFAIKDWGNDNWSAVLRALSASDPELGIVFVGSRDERERNDLLAASWSGPKLNSCGMFTPRETAALIERATLFLGHDTGTMHLAAAVDTRALGLFCARDVPGIWYTDRPDDHFFYNQTPCYGCAVTESSDCEHDLACMTLHSREDVIHVTLQSLSPLASPDVIK